MLQAGAKAPVCISERQKDNKELRLDPRFAGAVTESKKP
jgi:hypothetical protein